MSDILLHLPLYPGSSGFPTTFPHDPFPGISALLFGSNHELSFTQTEVECDKQDFVCPSGSEALLVSDPLRKEQCHPCLDFLAHHSCERVHSEGM